MTEMKTLTFPDGSTYKVVDDEARKKIDELLVENKTLKSDVILNRQTLGYECKNSLPYPFYETTHTDNGINWVDNGDGTLLANGTATNTSAFMMSRTKVLKAGRYILSGCPSGGSTASYTIRISDEVTGSTIIAQDNGDGALFEITEEIVLRIYARVYKGFTVNNLTFKPMIRKCDENGNVIGDDTYEVYKPNVSDLLNGCVKVIPYDIKVSIAATGIVRNVSTITNLSDDIFSNYTILGVVGGNSSNAQVLMVGGACNAVGELSLILYNAASQSQSATITVNLLVIRNELLT